MKIASASLQMAATHTRSQQHEISESLKMWVGPRRPGLAGDEARSRHGDHVTLSDAGRQAAGNAQAADDEANATVDGDPRLNLIRSMVELLTGYRIRIFDASELTTSAETAVVQAPATPRAETSTPAPAGYGVEYDYHQSYTETEQTDFSASGTVTTADGREISFNVQLSMSSVYHEESHVSLRLGDAARKIDPLVLNFSGTAAQLTDQRFAFDLDADGSDEQINFVAPGSGFLVFDRNRDGKINNGSELFGPTTDDGFRELAALDSDQNGWIDENDSAFGQLQLWRRDSEGRDLLQSLPDAGVGAIALSHVDTPFDVKTNVNQIIGQIRSSGIFLQDSGTAGTIQQIDLTA
jgi:hypothetical protein